MRWRRRATLALVAVASAVAAAWWMRVPAVPIQAAAPSRVAARVPAHRAPVPSAPRSLPPRGPSRSPSPAPPPAPGDPLPPLSVVSLPPPPPGATLATLQGKIVDDTSQLVADAWIMGEGPSCPWFRVQGGRFDSPVQPFHCQVYAMRMDGAIPVRSPSIDVDLAAGDEADLQLVLPSRRTGGVGIAFAFVDDGVVVRRVVPGTPAARAGLHPGDVIVQVDGTPTTDLSSRDFQEAMTGPEGTDVHFVVRYHDENGREVEAPVVATRAFVPGSALD